jgi:hypothetical protein
MLEQQQRMYTESAVANLMPIGLCGEESVSGSAKPRDFFL